jgi:hypothetical protein
MAFVDDTKSFFDELSNIADQQRAEAEEDMDMDTGRPYSSLLTQDEEPNEYYPESAPEQEPQVITRQGGGP